MDLVDRKKLEEMGLRRLGQFTLKCGVETYVKWDVDYMRRFPFWNRVRAMEGLIWFIGLLKPSLILGIRTGGYQIAEDIGKALDVRVLDEGYGCWETPGGGSHGHCVAVYGCPKTVIVDDVLTTGETVREVLERNEKTVAIAVLVNRSSRVNIDGVPILSGIVADRIRL